MKKAGKINFAAIAKNELRVQIASNVCSDPIGPRRRGRELRPCKFADSGKIMDPTAI